MAVRLAPMRLKNEIGGWSGGGRPQICSTKSISDTQLAYIWANLADSLVCSVKIISRKVFGNRISEKDRKISSSVSIYFLFSKLLNIRKRKRRISRCRLSLNPRCFPVLAPLATRKRRVQIFALSWSSGEPKQLPKPGLPSVFARFCRLRRIFSSK